MAIDLDNPYELAFVVNIGDKPLRFPVPGYDQRGNQKYANIAPGDRQLLPFDQAASAFGHPRAKNLSHKDRSRDELFAQLRTYWGFHIGFDTDYEDELDDQKRAAGFSSWEVKKPEFRVETVDGQWIPMVLDDPDGIHPLPDDEGAVDPELARASGSVSVMEKTLAAMMERDQKQQAVIADLISRLDAQGKSTADVDAAQTVPSDFSSHEDDGPTPQSSELPEPPANEPAPKTDRPRGVRASRPASE